MTDHSILIRQLQAFAWRFIVRGVVDSGGAVALGRGFTATRDSVGGYTVTFTTALPSVPIVVASVTGGEGFARTDSEATTGFTVVTRDETGSGADRAFSFIAITATSAA